jgi:hypothetical protein
MNLTPKPSFKPKQLKLATETPTETLPGRCAAPKLSATADGLRRYCEYSQVLVEHNGRPGRARREPRRVEVGAQRCHPVGAQLLKGFSRVLTGTAVVPRRVEVGAHPSVRNG